jgi:hypothetical protein
MVVRSLKGFGKFGATLPLGPARKYEQDVLALAGMTNDERFTKFVQCMEEEVVSLLALDDKAAKKFTGRADGPVFVLKNALGSE